MPTEIEVIEKIDETIKVNIPKMYKVLLHNDDKTTFDFVILILVRIFHRTVEDAVEVTKAIHIGGQGIAGSTPLSFCSAGDSPAFVENP